MYFVKEMKNIILRIMKTNKMHPKYFYFKGIFKSCYNFKIINKK
jgi:hypothetical protein